ncbi:MAG: hypothetical protein KF819_27275 [Labilithrix sp.]|nr:hypothetical protein [Labilithrix sp.]
MSGFEALGAFEPLARLVERDGTLDGSVPLRVAQACVPLLEGNALGHRIVFSKRLVVRARLGRRRLEASRELEEIDRAHAAAIPLLAAQGFLRRGGAWYTQLEKSWWWVERSVLRVWTGLLVRPRPGTWLRVTGAGSRAILGLGVRAAWIADAGELVPLVLDFDAAPDGARLEGEVATIVPVVPGVRAEIVMLRDQPALGEAHAAFYDAKYFAAKKSGEVTRKYRRTIARAKATDEVASRGSLRVAHLAGPRPEVATIDRALGPGFTSPVAVSSSLQVVRFANAVGFTAHYDGNTLAIEPDRAALARGARAVTSELAAALGEGFVPSHEGAVLYLTKYFTPHPHGEPHFFVKPWAFTETPPGWSSILEGVRGEGFDVMRGVVWTDRFHATPAVFAVCPTRKIRVPAGARLLEVAAVPRTLLDEGFEMRNLGG